MWHHTDGYRIITEKRECLYHEINCSLARQYRWSKAKQSNISELVWVVASWKYQGHFSEREFCTWPSKPSRRGIFSNVFPGNSLQHDFFRWKRNQMTVQGTRNIFVPPPGFECYYQETSVEKQETRIAVARSPLRPPYCPTYDLYACAQFGVIENFWRQVKCFQILARQNQHVFNKAEIQQLSWFAVISALMQDLFLENVMQYYIIFTHKAERPTLAGDHGFFISNLIISL